MPEVAVEGVASEEALTRVLEQAEFQLAILDFYFPGSHGLAVMERLRQVRPRVPVIFFCGTLESSVEEQIFEAGPDDYIHKNSTGFLLLPRAVKRHLARARLGRRRAELPPPGLQQLLDQASVGFFRADENGGLLDATPTLARLLGAESVEELRRLGHRWRTPAAEGEGGTDSAYQLQLTTAQGDRRWYSIVEDVSLEDGAGVVYGLVMDISELKSCEDRSSQLEVRVNEFATMAGHEFREPLRLVREYTRMLKEDHGQSLDSKGREFLEFTHDAALRMRRMLDNLLLLLRSGEDLQAEGCDANELVKEALLNLKTAVDESGAVVTWDELPQIWGDCRQLVLVFQNLISNGIKFKRDFQTPRIQISSSSREDEVLISFRDNGVGIKAEQLESIFQSFRRLHPERPGSGLGLAICRRIVERHQGRIWAQSRPGEGSTFVVALPVRPSV